MMPSEKLIDLLLAFLCERSDKSKLSNAEWEALSRLATKHGVAPLLYHRLSNANLQVPERVLDALCENYHHNAFKNAQYYQELAEVLKRLQDAGIEVIVLKGAYLAKTVYQPEALRVIGDIDLLVKEADLGQSEKILLEMGYGPTERPSIETQCAMSLHLEPFIKKGAFPIEIHWTLFSPTVPFKNRVDILWDQARSFTVATVQVLTLSPEDLLFHLCVHGGYSNRFVGMRFLCDIHNTIRYYEIDWDLLFHRARQWKAEKALYLTLYTASDWGAANVPEKVFERFKPSDFNLELVVKLKEITRLDIINRWRAHEKFFAALWIPNKPFREKLSIFLERIFPPLESLAEMYDVPKNSFRIYFYYLVRLKYLLFKYSGMVWRMLRGDKKAQTFIAQNNQITILKDWMKSN
jgi:hypothetical protein